MKKLFNLVVCVLGLVLPVAAQNGPHILSSLQQELDRNVKELHLEKMQRPYFIGYRLIERESFYASASFGSILGTNANHYCELEVELRVGSPKFDNANFFTGNTVTTGTFKSSNIVLSGDPVSLRRALWLATDDAFKQALKDYAQKEAVAKNRSRLEELDDFSAAPACTVMEDNQLPLFEQERCHALLKKASDRFRQYAKIASSQAYISCQNVKTYYVNSDRSRYVRGEGSVCFGISASTQLPDGVPLEDSRQIFAPTLASAGSEQQLMAVADSVGSLLTRLCSARLVERYIGPVLFEDQAALELFRCVMMPQFCVVRRPLCANAAANPTFDIKPFIDRLGGRVLPDNMTVVDDPTITTFRRSWLAGSFSVDDEGVKANKKVLVENGILKSLLTTRGPVFAGSTSSGNRNGMLPLPSNLLVVADKGLAKTEMVKKLVELVHKRKLPFGIIVRRIGDPNAAQFTVNRMQTSARGVDGGTVIKGCVEVCKIFPDGHEELVRNAELSGISPEVFKYLFAVSRDVYVDNLAINNNEIFPFYANESHLVSLAVPWLLFDDVVVKKINEEVPKAPFWGHPFFNP